MSDNAFARAGPGIHGGALRCVDCPLRRLDLYQPVNATELALIDELKHADVDYRAGELLIAENADDTPLFTLLRGWAIRFKTLGGGRRQILHVLLPGDFIGLQQKMSDAASHGVQALTDVHVCRFARDAVWTLHRELPALGYDVTWLSANQNSLVDDNLLSVGRRSALERVAALLLTLYARALPHDGDAGAVGLHFPLTQQHIADAMGLSLVHTHRVLRQLRQRGLYEPRDGARLLLPDPEALAQLAHLRWPLAMARAPLI
jgi:CRP-like cAMP-binding protein